MFSLFSFLFSTLFATQLKLSDKQADFIAQKVWQNEGAGLDKYLVHWNDGEDFASVGIGHFIWFSKGHTERFREVFPMANRLLWKTKVSKCLLAQCQNAIAMEYQRRHLSQQNRQKAKQYTNLFDFLKATMPEQAAFMAQRLSEALPQMLETIDDAKTQELIKRRFYEVMHNQDGSVNEQGLYVLLDYTNFKGEGTLESERYKGRRVGTASSA